MNHKKPLGLFGLKTLLAFLLLQFSSTALGFTIIELPDSNSAPGSSITEASSFGNQIQPVIGAVQSRMRDARRTGGNTRTAQIGQPLAFNSHAQTMSDADSVMLSYSGLNGGGGTSSLWLNSSFTSFDNDFSRTKYDGRMQMLMAGYDRTAGDRYIYGVAISYETSDIDTTFNTGNQEVYGFSINPYFSYLFSDAWSIDLSLGFGDFDIEQFRSVGAIAPGPSLVAERVTSETSTTRQFLASNLTYGSLRGKWYLSGWLGLMLAEKDQDGYTESDGTEVKSQDLDIERWSLGGEAAYGDADAETYFGLIFEKDNEIDEIEFASGDQPDYDDETMLLSLGWRYFGRNLTANIELSSRLLADDVSENTFSSTLRLEL